MSRPGVPGGRVAGLILAAGEGRRYGGPKAPVFLGQAIRVLRDGGCDPIIAILGAGSRRTRATVDLAGVEVVDNPGWAEGMASSLRLGLTTAARSPEVSAVCVHLVDMPGVSATAVTRLLARAHAGGLIRACYDGEPGHPVVLGRDHWAEIVSTVRGDQGARAHLRRHAAQVDLVECADVAAGYDIDER
ncbi:NTP transferase domain-containing protein [Micromonospora sp. NPDC002575]|uniref:nucleotidyltransferase family protein n=1 Tax=Micromonospora sp. NPDC002575 TaxID=3364222 RepID=UPI0036A27499